MEKEVDIVALGELLIDFTEAGYGKDGMKLFEQNPGGAPANLLTVASHMGCRTSFIGKVGKDMHGAFLKRTLQNEGIAVDHLIEDDKYFTTLAFVEIDENGERKFSFARKPGADTQLRKEELDPTLLQKGKIFHFGSLSLTDEPAKSATLEAVHIAKDAGALISYDPNYRASLWKNEQTAVQEMKAVIPFADVMKVSDEESLLLTGKNSYEEAAEELLSMGPELIAITLGSDGVLVETTDGKVCLGGLQAISGEYYEAAKMDGASKFQCFKSITLPMVTKLSIPLVISSFAANFNNFGNIYMITQGGPARVDNQFAGYTDILASTTYKMTTWSNRYELSATFSVLIFIIVGTFTLINMRLSGSFKEVD